MIVTSSPTGEIARFFAKEVKKGIPCLNDNPSVALQLNRGLQQNDSTNLSNIIPAYTALTFTCKNCLLIINNMAQIMIIVMGNVIVNAVYFGILQFESS